MKLLKSVFLVATLIGFVQSLAFAAAPGISKSGDDDLITDYQGKEYRYTRLIHEGDVLSKKPFVMVSRLREVGSTRDANAFNMSYEEKSIRTRPTQEIVAELSESAKTFCRAEGSALIDASIVIAQDIKSAGSGGLDSISNTPISAFFGKRRIVSIVFNCEG